MLNTEYYVTLHINEMVVFRELKESFESNIKIEKIWYKLLPGENN